ncbi:MAG: ATP-binding protein [Candidatus Helarchaeales archaeon]
MMRDIIKIDEEKCNGCGECVPNCPEGAIQIIDGKARLVSDLYCDGLGACIGFCPEGAISVEKREAEPYDERKVMDNIIKGGINVIKAHLKHLQDHGETELYNQAVQVLEEKGIENPLKINGTNDDLPSIEFHLEACGGAGGCPGLKTMDFRDETINENPIQASEILARSELKTWPIQLRLLNPRAPFLKNADLLVSADCVPFSFASFHERFLKGKVLVNFCPKLDASLEMYVEKLSEIFENQDIRSITLVHMEVACCFGLKRIVEAALKNAKKDLKIKDYTISVRGEIMD